MKPIPLPVRPEPVEVVPVIEHRVQFDVGPDTVSVLLTGSIERKIAPPKRKTPAQVRAIAESSRPLSRSNHKEDS